MRCMRVVGAGVAAQDLLSTGVRKPKCAQPPFLTSTASEWKVPPRIGLYPIGCSSMSSDSHAFVRGALLLVTAYRAYL